VQAIELPNPKAEPRSLGFSADGRLLAAWDYGRVYVIDTAAGVVHTVQGARNNTHVSTVPGTGFTAAGHVVDAYLGHSAPLRIPNDYLRIREVDSGRIVCEAHRTEDRFPEPAPKGPRGDSAPGPRQDVVGDFRLVEVGPGGRLIYLVVFTRSSKGMSVVRWNPLTGKTLPPFAHRGQGGHLRLAVSADERWVASVCPGRVIRMWDLGRKGLKPDSRASRQFAPDSATVYDLALSADGAFVAYYSSGVGISDVRTGELWKLPGPYLCSGRELAFHPARPVLAFSGASADVAFYDVAARTELKRYAWDIKRVRATAFSPDGLRCAAAGAGKVVIWDVDV
jgi:WD40 repeat protein